MIYGPVDVKSKRHLSFIIVDNTFLDMVMRKVHLE